MRNDDLGQLLAVFTVNKTSETFDIYGHYDVETMTDISIQDPDTELSFDSPVFSDLVALKHRPDCPDEPVPYVPDNYNWAGIKYTVQDMIEALIQTMIFGGKDYTVHCLENGLQKIVDNFKATTAVTVDGKNISAVILGPYLSNLYQLTAVTDKYFYYVVNGCDEYEMFDTKTHQLISDNSFAYDGLMMSAEAVKKGEETLLYGTLPEPEDSDDSLSATPPTPTVIEIDPTDSDPNGPYWMATEDGTPIW